MCIIIPVVFIDILTQLQFKNRSFIPIDILSNAEY